MKRPPRPPAAPPKRDPGARYEPRTGVRQTGSYRRYPVLGPPISAFGDREASPSGQKEKGFRERKCEPLTQKCYRCIEPKLLPMY